MAGRPEISEIDRQLAEMERMAGMSGSEVSASKPGSDDEGGDGKKSRLPGWPTILGVVLVIDLAARFFIPASDSFVRILEGSVFGTAAVALAIPLFRKRGLSDLRRKIHGWLGALLGLGGIRSLMWGLGVPVEIANLTIFLLGLGGLAALFFFRKRTQTDATNEN